MAEIPSMLDIKNLHDYTATLPQVSYPAQDHFSENVYVREFRMPAEHYVVGKEHKTRHLNILTTGICTVWTVHGKHVLDATKGPKIFESLAGMKKVVLAHTDIVWLTVHPTEETSTDRLEFEMINPTEQEDLFPDLDKNYLVGGMEKWLGQQ